MKRILLIAIAAAAFLSAGAADLTITIDCRSAQRVKHFPGVHIFSPDDEVYSTATAEVYWPERIGANDLGKLQQTLIEKAFGIKGSRDLAAALKRHTAWDASVPDGSGKGVEVPTDTDIDAAIVFTNNVRASILEFDSSLITWQLDYETYEGGAHGLNSVDYVNYDVEHNRIITLADLFPAGKRAALTKAIKAKLYADFDVSTDAQAEEAGLMAGQIEAPDCFYIEDGVLTFVFNPYTIAPYALGIIEVEMPGEALAPLASDYAADLLLLPEPDEQQ